MISAVFRLTGWYRKGAVSAPLMTSGTLVRLVIVVTVGTLAIQLLGPETDLIKTVWAPLLTVVWIVLVLLRLMKSYD